MGRVLTKDAKDVKLCRFISEKDLFGNKEEEDFEKKTESAFRNEKFPYMYIKEFWIES